jgi:predicted amidohydrolase YtcJ
MRRHAFGRISEVLFLSSLVPVLLLAAGAPASAGHEPDLILHHGRVFTVDPGRPWAEAVAVRGARIVAVGADAAVRALAGPETVSYDLGGRVVVPGFNDAHAHLGVGFPRLTLPPIDLPGPGPTLAVALAQVAEAVAVAEPGEWILSIVGEALILDPAADRLAVDAVAPANPVILLAWSSHSAVINSAAMAAAGIAAEEPDPFGGSYGRFPGTDVVDGRIHEYALFGLVRAVRAEVPDAVLRAEFEFLTAQAARLGVTSVQEMTIGLTRERSERVLAGAEVSVRMRLLCVPMTLEESCRPALADPSDRLISGGIKWLLDGTPVERSAALREPYADFPGTGRFNVAAGELERLVRRSLFGLPVRDQLVLHAIGDRALDNVLGGLERAAPAFVWRLLRPRIEHGDLLHPAQVERARRLGAVVVQNPSHLTLDLEPALGPERAAAAQPLRSLLDAGVDLAFGSASAQPNPFVDLFFAVAHPFHPGEALSVEEAVTAYTRGSAIAEFQEWRKGSLRPGYLADLAVLSQDVFAVPPAAIPATVSLLTLVGGEVVWDAGVLAPSP